MFRFVWLVICCSCGHSNWVTFSCKSREIQLEIPALQNLNVSRHTRPDSQVYDIPHNQVNSVNLRLLALPDDICVRRKKVPKLGSN